MKGFVRSTVNQVGRDTGKVISNKIYKDKHSSPVKIAGNEEYATGSKINKENQERPSDFKHEFFSDSWYMYLFTLLGSIILFPVSWIYFLGKGLIYLTKKTITLSGIEVEEVYKEDKRFKSGVRLEGHKEIKKIIEFPASKNELQINRIKGLLHLGIILLYLIPLIYYMKS